MTRFQLEIHGPNGEVTTREVGDERLTLGAGPLSDIVLSGDGVAFSHAAVEIIDGAATVSDLQSPDGTFVGEERITERRPLNLGDEIKVGAYRLVLRAADAGAPLTVAEALLPPPPPDAFVASPDAAIPAMAAAVPTDEATAAPESPTAPTTASPAFSLSKPEDTGTAAEAPAAAAIDAAIQARLEAQIRAKEQQHAEYDVTPHGEAVEAKKQMWLEVREISYGDHLDDVRHYAHSARGFTELRKASLWWERPFRPALSLVGLADKPLKSWFPTLKAGEAPEADFYAPATTLGRDVAPLIEPTRDGVVVRFNERMNGSIHDGAQERTLAEIRAAGAAARDGQEYVYELKPGHSALFDFENSKVFTRFTNRADHIRSDTLKQMDLPFLTLLGTLIFLYGAVVFIMSRLPAPEVIDTIAADERFLKIMAEQAQDEEPPEPPKEAEFINKSDQGAALGEEGKTGEEEAVIDKAAGSARRALDEKVVDSTGILGSLDQGLAAQDKLFGGGSIGAGLDEFLGNADGIYGADQRGAGGLGARGSGQGGGGNSLGLGGIGTHGRGGGGRGGRGTYGIGEGDLAKNKGGLANVSTRNATVMGALDRSIIEKIIKRHQSQIRFCYQRELAKNPQLYGRITIKFIIGGTGQVQSSSVANTTMNNSGVEDCVANTIKRIVFPQPKGGGIVVVNFPFVFAPVNQ